MAFAWGWSGAAVVASPTSCPAGPPPARSSRPAAAVEAVEAAAEDFEHLFDVGAGPIDDGEGAGAEGRGHLAGVVTPGAGAFDDDGGRRGIEASQEFKDAGTGLLGGAGAAGVAELIEGKAEIDDGDVDGDGLDDAFRLHGGAGADGMDPHGFQKTGEAVGPGIGPPGGAGKEEIEAVQGGAGAGGIAADGARGVVGIRPG